MEDKPSKSHRLKGWCALSLFAALILSGIIAKRVYGHPDMVVFFHLPAAVMLVFSWYQLSYSVRRRHKLALKKRGYLN